MAAGQTTQPKDTEMIYRQKFAREQFQQLMAKMLEAADLLAQSEPESAKAIRQAVKQAQAAFIAEDMDKVVEMLAQGLLTPADQREAKIITDLKAMLEVLRSGKLELDKQLEMIARWKTMLAKMDELIGRQQEHERKSRVVDQGPKMAEDLAGLQQRLDDVVARQKQLLGRTEAQPAPSDAIQRLSALHRRLVQLAKGEKTLGDVTANLPIGQLPAAEKAQADVARQTESAAGELKGVAGDAELAKALQDAGAGEAAAKAQGSVAQARKEMATAGEALGKSDKATASQRQLQAAADLNKAANMLGEALSKLGEKSGYAGLAGEQGKLADDTRGLADEVKKAAEAAGGASEPASRPAASRPGEPASRPDESTSRPGEAAPGQSFDRLDRAAEAMDQAAGQLKAQRKADAAEAQRRALAQLADDRARLAELKRRLEQEARKPDFADQQSEQDKTAQRTDELAATMKNAGAQEGASAPGQASVSQAGQNMGKASQNLGKQQAGQANQRQKEALDDLNKARRELQQSIAQAEEALQAETLVQIEELLRKCLREQIAVNQETVQTQSRAGESGFERAEEIKCRELAGRQGKQADQVGKIVRLIEKEGTTAVFPAVLEEVRKDMVNVQELLNSLQAGPLTQEVQKQIAESLTELIASLQKEMKRREAKGGGSKGGGGGGGGSSPLVPMVAELKMLRSLQLQVNRRTEELDAQNRAGKVDEALGRNQHALLGDRQAKVAKLARELDAKMRPAQGDAAPPAPSDEGEGDPK